MGVVKFFDPVAGYGFIIPEGGGKDVFFHQTALQETTRVSTGHEVEYSLFQVFGKDKPRALSVRLLNKRSLSYAAD
jgi:cold shock CspA family protein